MVRKQVWPGLTIICNSFYKFYRFWNYKIRWLYGILSYRKPVKKPIGKTDLFYKALSINDECFSTCKKSLHLFEKKQELN